MYKITVKYVGQPPLLYDSTKVESWANVQLDRAIREHPGAEVKVIQEK